MLDTCIYIYIHIHNIHTDILHTHTHICIYIYIHIHIYIYTHTYLRYLCDFYMNIVVEHSGKSRFWEQISQGAFGRSLGGDLSGSLWSGALWLKGIAMHTTYSTKCAKCTWKILKVPCKFVDLSWFAHKFSFCHCQLGFIQIVHAEAHRAAARFSRISRSHADDARPQSVPWTSPTMRWWQTGKVAEWYDISIDAHRFPGFLKMWGNVHWEDRHDCILLHISMHLRQVLTGAKDWFAGLPHEKHRYVPYNGCSGWAETGAAFSPGDGPNFLVHQLVD